MELYDLKVLHRRKPIIDEMPYFSWKIASNRENVLQEAYRIVVRRGEYVLWDSGKVFSREQAFIPYQGEAFASCTCYSWEVSVWDNYGEPARAKSSFATAFLEESDWHADWIECSFTREAANEYKFGNAYPPVLFEKEFSLDSGIKQAVLYATAHGVYRPKINDERLDDREFAPEYTPYDSLLYYQTYDVTELLREGSNDLSFYVGDGWYFSAQAQPVMEEEKRHSEPSVLFQLQIEYQDGRKERICSDGGETCRLAEIVYSDLYQGEKQDFSVKEEQTRYPVCVKGYGYDFLRAQPMEPIRPMECIPAVELFMSPAGEMIVDFGQMIAGRARIALHDMSPGQEAVFEYFEILDADGNYINTMFAPQKDTVISDGKDRLYEAAFTFHGFRYLRVMGMKQAKKEDFTAVLLTTEKENAGSFACSDERLNRLYRNVRYSQYNNMMSVPTDSLSQGSMVYPSTPWDSHFQASSDPKARLTTVTQSLTMKAE